MNQNNQPAPTRAASAPSDDGARINLGATNKHLAPIKLDAAGLAAFPFLQYRKVEMPDCALKALEYAFLLPLPQVGICNSLALNISADRRYSLGDVFGALEEYKLALLADKANVRLDKLSGGQQQKVQLGVTIMNTPELLILDEPTSALDPISTGAIEDLIEDLKSDYTIAMVTHNMQQAARISDYTAYMYLGDMVEMGETHQVFTSPAQKATEDYIAGRHG